MIHRQGWFAAAIIAVVVALAVFAADAGGNIYISLAISGLVATPLFVLATSKPKGYVAPRAPSAPPRPSPKINPDYPDHIARVDMSKLQGNQALPQTLANDLLADVPDEAVKLPDIPLLIFYQGEYDSEPVKREIIAKYIYLSDYGDFFVIRAFCKLKNAHRTFLTSRIHKMAYRGEEADPTTFFLDYVKDSKEYKRQKLYEEHGDMICILNYIGRIDDRYSKKEKEYHAAYFVNVCGLDVSPDMIYSRAMGDYTPQDFKRAVAVINKWDPQNRAILKAYIVAGAGVEKESPLRKAHVDLIKGEPAQIDIKLPTFGEPEKVDL